MKQFVILFFVLWSNTFNGFSQSAGLYKADLDKLRSILQQTPSYKAQIRGKAEVAYKKLYDSLGGVDGDKLSSLDYFTTLSQMFFPLRDNHLGFYEKTDNALLTDTALYRKLQAMLDTASHPSVSLNLDSLQQLLLQKQPGETEGIYHYGKIFSFGLYKASRNEYIGVILNSQVSYWKPGQVVVKLLEYAPGSFRAVYANPVTKKFNLYPNEKYRNESLINSYFYPAFVQANYRKTTDTIDFVNISKKAEAFALRNLRADVQYLRLGNFSAFPKMMEISDRFYQSMKDSLSATHLIVDLRNNTGGAEKVSKKFFKLIKQHARKANIYVLVNNGTLSQGEIFMLQLKKIRNVTTYGQTTQGKIAYGSNYGKRVLLPSGKLEVYITDMKDRKGLVKYENVGITPQVVFDNSTDWLQRLLAIIENSKK